MAKRRLSMWRLTICLITTTSLFGVGSANATLITSPVDPLLAGASLITFDEVPVYTLNPVIAGVGFVGTGGYEVTTYDLAIQPGHTSPVLANPIFGVTGAPYDIFFSVPVSAFGFSLAGINRPTTIEAFDFDDASLGTASFGSACCSSVFRGLGDLAAPVSRVRVTTTDLLHLDDLYYREVPEPSALALLSLGLVGLAIRERRR